MSFSITKIVFRLSVSTVFQEYNPANDCGNVPKICKRSQNGTQKVRIRDKVLLIADTD